MHRQRLPASASRISGSVGLRVALQQVVRGDDQAGRAEAALHGARVDERLLHGVQLLVGPRPSTVVISRPCAWPAGDEAGADRHAVEVDRAGAALALLAGVLGARQAEPLAQRVEQALALPDVVGRARVAVDGQL